MREIKFRAWVATERRYKAGMYEWQDILDTVHTEVYGKSLLELGMNPEVPEVTLMQYTGLKDKNRVEIYEGDVVATPIIDMRAQKLRTKRAKVIWYEAGWFLDVLGDALNSLNDSRGSLIEVIGNIYEHPELLKETA